MAGNAKPKMQFFDHPSSSRRVLEMKNVLNLEAVMNKLFANFPVLQIMDEKTLTKLSSSFSKIVGSLSADDISAEGEITNGEKCRALLNWFSKVFAAAQNSLLDRRCLLQARVAYEFDWRAGNEIYDFETSCTIMDCFVKVLVQKLMNHAFPEPEKSTCLRAADVYLSDMLAPKINERLKLKPFKNSSDYLGNILDEFVAAPISSRTNADYLLLCDVFETLRDEKEISATEFKQILSEAHARCGDEGILIIIMQKHLDLLDSPLFSLESKKKNTKEQDGKVENLESHRHNAPLKK